MKRIQSLIKHTALIYSAALPRTFIPGNDERPVNTALARTSPERVKAKITRHKVRNPAVTPLQRIRGRVARNRKPPRSLAPPSEHARRVCLFRGNRLGRWQTRRRGGSEVKTMPLIFGRPPLFPRGTFICQATSATVPSPASDESRSARDDRSSAFVPGCPRASLFTAPAACRWARTTAGKAKENRGTATRTRGCRCLLAGQ